MALARNAPAEGTPLATPYVLALRRFASWRTHGIANACATTVRDHAEVAEDIMKIHAKLAFVAIALFGLAACGVQPAPPETVAQETQAATNCEACFWEWSYCDDNCTPECA